MADWLLSPRQNAPRVFYAGTLLSVPLLVLLGAWFVSGWHDVQMRQHELIQAPRLVAERRASELSRELHSELEALIGREYSRPYFHYQNLMHDPRASPGLNVSPSPLAGGSEDKLVLGYFQVDANGLTTTPTINDDLPSLSAAERLADHRAFRDHVARDLSQSVKPKQSPTASAGSPPPTKLATSQKLTIDSNIYEQNAKPNTVYFQQAVNARPPALRKPSRPVTITVSPLEWRTLPFDRGPALVAIREVETPEGTFAQGFVVDRSALTSRLTSRAGGMVAELHADATGGAVVAPGWSLSVKPDSLALDQADAEARDVARGFLTRFVGIGSIAALAAAFVLVLVARSEKLARERSQFAAAAAHELRTPLSGLQLYGDMLADGLGDPAKARDYARRMSEEASRLGRVVSNVLGFSQLESGTLTVDAQVGPLGEALCELANVRVPLSIGPVWRSNSTCRQIFGLASTATRSRASSETCSTMRRSTPGGQLTARSASRRWMPASVSM